MAKKDNFRATVRDALMRIATFGQQAPQLLKLSALRTLRSAALWQLRRGVKNCVSDKVSLCGRCNSGHSLLIGCILEFL